MVNCQSSCATQLEKESRVQRKLENVRSFYDLQAEDIDGNVVRFDEFRNKVVVLTNVASECGYTEPHYRGLGALWNALGGNNSRDKVELVAFPCNQFGQQEPGTPAEIKNFVFKEKGAKFLRLMNKVNVNGPDTHLVYLWLKKQTNVPAITWNFATYFVVTPDGRVESYSGIEPTDLKSTILHLLSETTTTTGGAVGDAEEEEEL